MTNFLADKKFPFQAWKVQDKQMTLIKIQWGVIILEFVLMLLLWMGWHSAPQNMVVYLPPDLSQGTTTKPNQISTAYVYAFGFQIWQELNYWPNNGNQDYKQNIDNYGAYLTPRFKQALLEDFNSKQSTGELSRVRTLQGMQGAAFNIKKIKKLSANSWEVDIDAKLTESSDGVVTKDVEIEYPLRVVRMQISTTHNAYGLALDGVVSPPKRIKTFV